MHDAKSPLTFTYSHNADHNLSPNFKINVRHETQVQIQSACRRKMRITYKKRYR